MISLNENLFEDAEILYVIKDRKGRIVSDPSPDKEELWDKVNFMDDTKQGNYPHRIVLYKNPSQFGEGLEDIAKGLVNKTIPPTVKTTPTVGENQFLKQLNPKAPLDPKQTYTVSYAAPGPQGKVKKSATVNPQKLQDKTVGGLVQKVQQDAQEEVSPTAFQIKDQNGSVLADTTTPKGTNEMNKFLQKNIKESTEGIFDRKFTPERKYFLNDEEVKSDDFYDALVSTSVTTQQMIDLENNHDKNNPLEIDGDTFFIEQEKKKKEEPEDEEDISNVYTKLTESYEDGIINIVTFKNNASGFYDSIDFFSEEDAQNKVEELLQFPGRYSDVKTVRMTKQNQQKFLKNEEEQDKFLEDGNIPDKYIEEVINPDDEPEEQSEEEVITDDEDISLNDEEPVEEKEEETEEEVVEEEPKQESYEKPIVPQYIIEQLNSQPDPVPHTYANN